MAQYGLLFDNEYCTGCHSCEVACKNEHDLPLGQWGIKLLELRQWKLMDGKHWEQRFVPVPTMYCDLCRRRIESGADDVPSCVRHCLASAIEYGTLEELAKKLEAKGRRGSVFLP